MEVSRHMPHGKNMKAEPLTININDKSPLPDRSNEITLAHGLGVALQPDGRFRIFHEWISVKDRLPDLYEEVLVFRSPPDQITISTILLMVDNEPLWRDQIYYSHWMPLPKPPEE